MYAVVRTGGKQYRVAKDEVVVVEKLAGEPGGDIELAEVLVLDSGSGAQIGSPLVEGARVFGTVIAQDKTDKVLIFKRKRRKNHRRLRGHRQNVTVLRITDILARGEERAPRAAAEPAPAEVEAVAAAAGTSEAAPESTAKATKKAAAPAKKPAAKKAPAKKKPARKSEE
jgi:large subunit ribosomal protein L21